MDESFVCRVCGKPLSNPVSVKRGIGPKCWAALQTKKKDRERNDETGAKCKRKGTPLTKEEADRILRNPSSSPAQRTDARVVLGMPYEEAMRLEAAEDEASEKLWEEHEEESG